MNESPLRSTKWTPSPGPAILALLLGGFVGLGIAVAVEPVFPYPDLKPVPNEPTARDAELIEQHVEARKKYFSQNYAVSFAILGLCIGSTMGYLCTPQKRLLSAIAGGVLAMIGGALAAYFVASNSGQAFEESESFTLTQAAFGQIPIWCAMICGLTAGIGGVQGGTSEAARSFVAGAVSSLVAVCAYLLLASVVFLRDNMLHMIPVSWVHRCVWIGLFSLVIGSMLWIGLKAPPTNESDAPVKKDEEDPDSTAE